MRQELGLIGALALTAFLSARLLGHDKTMLALAGAVYLAWHAANVVRLLLWLGRPRFATPLSFGMWEQIFDRLQAINLRGRKRRRRLIGFVRQLRLVLGGVADAAVVFDDRGRVRWFNTAAEQLLGLERSTTSRVSIADIVDHPLVADPLGVSGAAEIPSPVNGAVILRIEVSELEGTGRWLLIARDITKTHHLERARKDFVANVSHELRTPLTVFRGYLEMLADEAEQQPSLTGPVTQLDQQAARMQSLVEDLLDLSRVDFAERSSHRARIDVAEMIESIIDELQAAAEVKDHEIVEDIDRQLGLLGNRAILRMIFANLIVNAVKHNGRNTRSVVTWCRENDQAIFQVKDNGQGIAANHLPRLTERFYRVDSGRTRGGGGTGLGLAIVRHALERHDATIQIESTLGQGSSFTCRFPAARIVPLPKRTPWLSKRQRSGAVMASCRGGGLTES